MEIPVFIIVGEWLCTEKEEWNFVAEKGKFGRCVRVKENMTYTELTCTVCEVFSLKATKFIPNISYWMPGKMSMMIESKRPPVFIDNQVSLDTFFCIRSGDPSVNMFVSFSPIVNHATVEVSKENVEEEDQEMVDEEENSVEEEGDDVDEEEEGEDVDDDETVDNDYTDGANDSSCMELTVDGSEGDDEDYDYNKWTDFIVSEYGIGHDRHQGDVQTTFLPRDEFSQLLETCTSTDGRVRGGSNTSVVNEISDTQPPTICTYTGNGVPAKDKDVDESPYTDTEGDAEGHAEGDAEGDDSDYVNVVENPSGGCTVENVTLEECYAVYNSFPSMLSAEVNIVDNDAPPMFDDLANVRADVTEVEISHTGEKLYVGSCFINKKTLQLTLRFHAIKHCYWYKQLRSSPRRVEMVCKDRSCPWQLTAHVVGSSEIFKITRYLSIHTCSIDTRKNYGKHASYKVVGELMKRSYSSTQRGPRAVEVPHLILNDMNVRISYSTAWRAREVALGQVRGDDEKSYRFLPTYLYLLGRVNPGTTYHLHSTPEPDGTRRFKYVFVSLGASIKGLKYMRKVVAVDGTQLVGRYKGCLLIACAQDGNFQVFPIAFGVVDGETDASWIWFFEKLAEIVPDTEDLMIISDRHSSIYKGISVVYPTAHHGACIVHLERNVIASYGRFGVAGLFISAAKAYRVRDFKKYFEELRSRSGKCAEYLEAIGFEHWTRAYCKGERYNLMSSNIVESMNGVMNKAKTYPIVYMIEFIREVIMRWFEDRRKKAAKCLSSVTPEVDEQFLQVLPESGKYAVRMSGPWSFQVTSKSGEHFHVVLDQCTCTCLVYTRLRIPCEHALAAAIEYGINPKTTVAMWYSLKTFNDSYQEPVLPIEDPKEVDIPNSISDVILIPPHSRRPPGRPVSKRIPSTGEQLRKKRKKRPIGNRCTRCRTEGHNKKTCKNPI